MTMYDLYEDSPWRKVAEITKEELLQPGVIEAQDMLERYIVPQEGVPLVGIMKFMVRNNRRKEDFR